MHTQKLVEMLQFAIKILSKNEILTSIKGHNSDTYFAKKTCIVRESDSSPTAALYMLQKGQVLKI